MTNKLPAFYVMNIQPFVFRFSGKYVDLFAGGFVSTELLLESACFGKCTGNGMLYVSVLPSNTNE